MRALNAAHRAMLSQVREQIRTNGRASVRHYGSAAMDSVRVLESLNVLERHGDDLILVHDEDLSSDLFVPEDPRP